LRETFPMRARFLLGPAGSGKTFRCLAEIRHALQKNPDGAPLIFLAPKQATFQLERQLLADSALQGFTRLHILSFERLARFVLEKAGVALPQSLNDEGRIMVLRALLLRHEKDLKLFGHSARRPGFAQQLSQLLHELQQHQFTPDKLRLLSSRDNLRAELQNKLHDLALLFEKYADWRREHDLQDADCLLDLATDTLKREFKVQNPEFRIENLWLDGFAEMTPQELDLLAAIAPFCDQATLAFCLDAESNAGSSWLSIWSAVGKTVQQCRQRLEPQSDCKVEIETLPRVAGKSRFTPDSALAELEKNWAAPGKTAKSNLHNTIRIVTCADVETEAIFAAREILQFVRAGNRFRDSAVLVRQLDGYHKTLARIFQSYEIPFFLDRREPIAHHPLAELTRSALRTAAFDWKNEDWFAALKSGFCHADETELDALENAALEFGWRGQKWREPLPDERFERLRKKIFPPFEKFFARFSKWKFSPTGAQLVEAIRELWNELNVKTVLEKWSDEIANSTLQQFNASTHTTVLDQMNAWLDNVVRAFAAEPLPLRDWLPVLEAGLANLTVGVIPPALDQVLVGSIDRARNPDLKLCLVLGVNESVFPATPAAPLILTETERAALAQTASFGPDLREQLAHERYYGYIACTRASERLVLTYAHADVNGKTLNPSPFIAHLQNIFPALEIEKFQNEIMLANAQSVVEIAPLILENQASSFPMPDWEKITVLAAHIKEMRVLREPDEKENLSPAMAEKLYGAILKSSVSRLEEFAQCPFKFFVRAGLHAQERKVFELDARERGTFQHEVLKIFHAQLKQAGKRWRDVTPLEARECIGKIAAEVAANFRNGLLQDSAQIQFETRALTTSLQDFIEVIIGWMRGQYEFDPAEVELGFGGRHTPETAWSMDLDNGHQLALEGRIDRVDLWRENGDDSARAVVIDYKSGEKKLDSLLVANGVQLQLLAYLGALKHWKNPREIFGVEKLIPAGAFYVSLRGKSTSGETRNEILGDANAKKLAYQHNGRFDAAVLPQLDRIAAKDQFKYRLTSAGELYANSTEALSHQSFDELLESVESQLTAIGRKIYSGEASVDPYRKGRETPCEFCDYRAVCRIDPWTHIYRVLTVKQEDANEIAG